MREGRHVGLPIKVAKALRDAFGISSKSPKPYHGDEVELSHGESRRKPIAITTLAERDVEEILAHCTIQRKGTHLSYKECFVKWRKLPKNEASWEPTLKLWNHREAIKAYEDDATWMSPD